MEWPECSHCRFKIFCSDRQKRLKGDLWDCEWFTPDKKDYQRKMYCSSCRWKSHCSDRKNRNNFGCPDYEHYTYRRSLAPDESSWDRYISERGY